MTKELYIGILFLSFKLDVLISFIFVIIAKSDVDKVLRDAGVAANQEDLDTMMNKLEGKSFPELIT